MRINHNIPALNAHRQLNQTNRNLGGVLERLSSGKRINKAADDAAGMAISEKMKAQVRGLRKASQNTLDGISLIQTAEGAMNEVHSMLQRMRELAVQSANGTSTNDDRKAIQEEVNQLTSEINRIANGTEFNTRNLLRGNEAPNSNTTVHRMSTGSAAIISGGFDIPNDGLQGDLNITIDGEFRVVSLSSVTGDNDAEKEAKLRDAINSAIDGLGKIIPTDDGTDEGYELKTHSIGGRSSILIEGSPDVLDALGLTQDSPGVESPEMGGAEKDTEKAEGTILFDKVPEAGSSIIIGSDRVDFYDSSMGPYTGSNRSINTEGLDTVDDVVGRLEGLSFTGVKSIVADDKLTDVDGYARVTITSEADGFAGQSIFLEGTPEEFVTNLQVGPNQGQGFRLSVGNIRAEKMRISATSPDQNTGVKGASFRGIREVTDGLSSETSEYALDVSTEETATSAITVYDRAINHVAELRGALGAIQNRLEYTAANLDNTTENLTAALSRIEDADMALEMSEYTKLNILNQAGTAMLAQANQMPQSVLQLLGG